MSKEDKRLKSMPSSTKSQSGIPLPSPRYNAESEIPPSLTLFIAIRVQSPEPSKAQYCQFGPPELSLSVHLFVVLFC